MDNTTIGLAVILGPICLAIIVLVAIELTDRIPFPKAHASSEGPRPRIHDKNIQVVDGETFMRRRQLDYGDFMRRPGKSPAEVE